MHCTLSAENAAIHRNTDTDLTTVERAKGIVCAVSRMQTARAHRLLAERRARGCSDPGSPWSKRHAADAKAAADAVAASQAELAVLYRANEAESARSRVTAIPLANFVVLDLSKPASSSGRYPEVLDSLLVNQVRIRFFHDALAQGAAIRPGQQWNVHQPGCKTYVVEVL